MSSQNLVYSFGFGVVVGCALPWWMFLLAGEPKTHTSVEALGGSRCVEGLIVILRVTGPSPAKLVTCSFLS